MFLICYRLSPSVDPTFHLENKNHAALIASSFQIHLPSASSPCHAECKLCQEREDYSPGKSDPSLEDLLIPSMLLFYTHTPTPTPHSLSANMNIKESMNWKKG